jgi:hypothetical protein
MSHSGQVNQDSAPRTLKAPLFHSVTKRVLYQVDESELK